MKKGKRGEKRKKEKMSAGINLLQLTPDSITVHGQRKAEYIRPFPGSHSLIYMMFLRIHYQFYAFWK